MFRSYFKMRTLLLNYCGKNFRSDSAVTQLTTLSRTLSITAYNTCKRSRTVQSTIVSKSIQCAASFSTILGSTSTERLNQLTGSHFLSKNFGRSSPVPFTTTSLGCLQCETGLSTIRATFGFTSWLAGGIELDRKTI